MPQNFLYPQRDQPLLLPVDMREWLPEDDLVFVVLDAVAALDLGGFRRRYRADGHGRAAFDPEIMVALLLYGYGLWGARTRPLALTWAFYAARWYSLMRPPRTGRRLIRFWERLAVGLSGRGGRSWRLRWGRRLL